MLVKRERSRTRRSDTQCCPNPSGESQATPGAARSQEEPFQWTAPNPKPNLGFSRADIPPTHSPKKTPAKAGNAAQKYAGNAQERMDKGLEHKSRSKRKN